MGSAWFEAWRGIAMLTSGIIGHKLGLTTPSFCVLALTEKQKMTIYTYFISAPFTLSLGNLQHHFISDFLEHRLYLWEESVQLNQVLSLACSVPDMV